MHRMHLCGLKWLLSIQGFEKLQPIPKPLDCNYVLDPLALCPKIAFKKAQDPSLKGKNSQSGAESPALYSFLRSANILMRIPLEKTALIKIFSMYCHMSRSFFQAYFDAKNSVNI